VADGNDPSIGRLSCSSSIRSPARSIARTALRATCRHSPGSRSPTGASPGRPRLARAAREPRPGRRADRRFGRCRRERSGRERGGHPLGTGAART
jgi:hypothetical protein